MERLLTADEVAEYLRLNRETVLRRVEKTEIAAIKIGYRRPIPNEEDFAIFQEMKVTNLFRLDTGFSKYCKHLLG